MSKLHRFYVEPAIKLEQDFWFHEPALLHQWFRVLRLTPGREIVLFDGLEHERLYKIVEITDREAHLVRITDLTRKTPPRTITLFWSLLKKEKNDWVLQKCTELGVSHFVPLITDRCERSVLSQNKLERWEKIIVEAAEQCGRGDIPNVREPMNVTTVVADYKNKIKLFVCDQNGGEVSDKAQSETGVLVGPEGGWSEEEKRFFTQEKIASLDLHNFTLRAETASVVATTQLLQ